LDKLIFKKGQKRQNKSKAQKQEYFPPGRRKRSRWVVELFTDEESEKRDAPQGQEVNESEMRDREKQQGRRSKKKGKPDSRFRDE